MDEKDKKDVIKDNQECDLTAARNRYYELLDQGQQGLDLMMEVFRQSEHPRCGEIVAQLLKQNAELTDRIVDLHKKNKEIRKEDAAEQGAPQLPPGSTGNTTVLFATTSELQRLLQKEDEKDVTPVTDDDSD